MLPQPVITALAAVVAFWLWRKMYRWKQHLLASGRLQYTRTGKTREPAP